MAQMPNRNSRRVLAILAAALALLVIGLLWRHDALWREGALEQVTRSAVTATDRVGNPGVRDSAPADAEREKVLPQTVSNQVAVESCDVYGWLRVHVRDEFEAPIAGADVRLAFLDHARGDIEMVADDDGTCELGESLPPGRIRILATAAGRVGVQRIGFLPDPEAVVEAGVTIHSGYSVPLSSTTVFVAAA